jgi:cytochrome c
MRHCSLKHVCVLALIFSAACLAVPGLPNLASAQESNLGEKQFITSCGVCHTVEPGAPNRQGPNLHGVYGRKVASLENFKYSEALKKGDWVWTEETLDPWLENSQEAHPGTVMNYRQANPDKRKLVIGYLKSLSDTK